MQRFLKVSAVAVALMAGAGGLAVARDAGPDGHDRGIHHSASFDRGGWHAGMFGKHLDGKLAYLKAELKITPQQEPQWQAVESAVRTSVDRMRDMRPARGEQPQPTTAIERLSRMEANSKAAAESFGSVRAAFEPLYASMSEQQKKTADEMLQKRSRMKRR